MARSLIDASQESGEITPEATILSAKQKGKREAIVEAATDLFTNEGYETTTIAQVAKKAGVAVGTVYLYFKNKQEILYAAKYDWDEDFARLMSQTGLDSIPHQHRLRPLIKACFDICAENIERIQLMSLPPQVVGELNKTKHLIKNSPAMIQGIERWVEHAIADGVFRPVDPHAAAVISFGMVSAALEQCINMDESLNRELYIDMLVDNMQRWILRPEYLEQL